MTTAEIIIWVVLGLFLVFGLLPTMMMAGVLYTVLLVRTKPEKWNRSCSIPDDAEYVRMFDIGMEWAQTWAAHEQEVAIQNRRFRLCGEYFDFGFRPGRHHHSRTHGVLPVFLFLCGALPAFRLECAGDRQPCARQQRR